jgi:MFS family permease
MVDAATLGSTGGVFTTTVRPHPARDPTADPTAAVLLVSTSVSSASKGIMFSVSALYFSKVVGLSAVTVGAGLTTAGIVAILTTFVAGRFSDRYGARAVMTGSAVLQAAALGGYCLTRNTVTFIALACVALGAQGMQRTAQVTLIARTSTGSGRTALRARLRVATNIFIAVGSGAGALALAVGSVPAYRIALLTAALLVLLAVLPLRTLPALEPEAASETGPGSAGTAGSSPLHDRRYLAVAGLNGVVSVQFALLTVGMPLWVAAHTNAPDFMAGGLLILNTVLVTLFQVRATRRVTDLVSAARAVFTGSALLGLACVLYCLAGYPGTMAAIVLLVIAVAAHSFGEVVTESGGWELAFELADPRRPGAYQGVSQTGTAVGTALAPLLITSTAIAHGPAGWMLLGGMFLAAGAGTERVVGPGRSRND